MEASLITSAVVTGSSDQDSQGIIAVDNPYGLSLAQLYAVKIMLMNPDCRQAASPKSLAFSSLVRGITFNRSALSCLGPHLTRVYFNVLDFNHGVPIAASSPAFHFDVGNTRASLRRSGSFIPAVLTSITNNLFDEPAFSLGTFGIITSNSFRPHGLWAPNYLHRSKSEHRPFLYSIEFSYSNHGQGFTVVDYLFPAYMVFLDDEIAKSGLPENFFPLESAFSRTIADYETYLLVVKCLTNALTKTWLHVAKFFLDSQSEDSYLQFCLDDPLIRDKLKLLLQG